MTLILDSIATWAKRFNKSPEEVWADLKAEKLRGQKLQLSGIDERGLPRDVEPHWICYIESWVDDQPMQGCIASGTSVTPLGSGRTSDMPRQGGYIAFDRNRAQHDAYELARDRVDPPSNPPMRLRDVLVDEADLEALWGAAAPLSTAAGHNEPASMVVDSQPIERTEPSLVVIETASEPSVLPGETAKGKRGPKPGTVRRYAESDRALFPDIERLTKDKHTSANAAALELANQGKVAGTGLPESRSKRLANLYLKERPKLKLTETN